MDSLKLTLYLGITPDEGPEDAFEIVMTMGEMPGGLPPEVGQQVKFTPDDPDEPLQFEIDTCKEPNGDGVVEAIGHRWVTGEHMYFHWLGALERDARFVIVDVGRAHIDMVNPAERAMLQAGNPSS